MLAEARLEIKKLKAVIEAYQNLTSALYCAIYDLDNAQGQGYDEERVDIAEKRVKCAVDDLNEKED